MKATWQGHIALGRLGVPVRLYAASRSARPTFVQLHDHDSAPVERVPKCSAENREIPYNEIVRAIEYQRGRYITLTGQELERSLPQNIAKIIEVKQFCEQSEIDPIHFEKPYYIVPSRGGERSYALLREALIRSQKVMITQFAIHSHEHVGVIGLYGDLLVLHQLRFASEIVPRSLVKTRALPRPSPAEVKTLQSVIEHFSGPFYIEDYHDEWAERVHLLTERKAKGLPMPREQRGSSEATPETEIISALQDTLSQDSSQLGDEN